MTLGVWCFEVWGALFAPKSNINLNSEFEFFDRKEKIIRDLLI